MKGHSHGLPDQRFSEVRSALLKASWIEDPDGFREVIEGGVKGRQGRSLRTRVVAATYDYKAFFADLECVLSGHVQTARNKTENVQACHSFQLCKRCVAENFAIPAIENAFGEMDHPEDIVMITKLYMSSEEYSQACVFIPHGAFHKLASSFPHAAVPRKVLPKKAMQDHGSVIIFRLHGVNVMLEADSSGLEEVPGDCPASTVALGKDSSLLSAPDRHKWRNS